MRLAARKFAVLLWIGAAIVALDICLTLANMDLGYAHHSFEPLNPQDMRWLVVRVAIAQIVPSSGRIFVLGAIIWILGDIRDRLAPPQ